MSAVQGNPTAGLRPFRPLDIGQTVQTALQLYRNNAVDLWKLVAAVYVPIEILDVIIRRIGSSSTGGTLALLLLLVFSVLGALLAQGATFKLLLDLYTGTPTSWRHSLDYAGERIWSLIWLSVLLTVLVVVGFFLLVIPGIWLLVMLCVSVPILMYEGVGGFQALSRSRQLTYGRWWATFGRLLVAYVILLVVQLIFDAIENAILNGISSLTLFLILQGILNLIVLVVVTPLVAAMITVIYTDLRARNDPASSAGLTATGF